MSVPTFFVFTSEEWTVGPNSYSMGVANSVEVAGSFNNWIKVKMEKVYHKEWTLTLELPPGQYEYKFFVDNMWTHNEEKPTTQDNVGGLNNVITVEEKGDLKAALKSALEADYEKVRKMGKLAKLDDEDDEEELPFDVSYELLSSKIESDINGPLKEGYRCLLGSSAAFGWEEVCKLLISAGADVNLKEIQKPKGQLWESPENSMKSPLYSAAECAWPNICEILLSAGAVIEDSYLKLDWFKHLLSVILEEHWKKKSSLPPGNSDQVPEDLQVSMAELLSAPWNRITVPTNFVFTTKQNGACAACVEVAGSFNNWTKVKMRDHDEEWSLTLKLPPGQYQFKFLVDKKWTHIKENPTNQDNEGGLNNVITVEEKGVSRSNH